MRSGSRRPTNARAAPVVAALAFAMWLGVGWSPAYARSPVTQLTPPTTGSSTPPTTLAHATTVPRTTPTTRAAVTTVPATPAPTRVAPVVPVAPTVRRYVPTTFYITTTTVPATTTTLVGIRGKVPVAPVTVPLHTKGTSGHVDPVFAWLSGIGFAIALLIVAGRLFVTRPGGRDRAPLT